MPQAKSENHTLARNFIAKGAWRVDASLGLVYGKRGNPFRRMNTDGYIQIRFRDPDDYRQHRTVLAHRVVWEAVHGPLDSALTINHLNGIKTDNRLSNLDAVTQADNVRHAWATGLNRRRYGCPIPPSR